MNVPMQFWLFVSEALVEIRNYTPKFRLVEHVKRMDEGIRQDKIAEADEGLVGAHSNQKYPGKIAHSLDVLNVWSIKLKKLKKTLDLNANSLTLLLVQLKIHSFEVEVDDRVAGRFVLKAVMQLL